MNYRGWRCWEDMSRPVTGRWRAERRGVGLCGGTQAAVCRMIDRRCDEEAQARRIRETERRNTRD